MGFGISTEYLRETGPLEQMAFEAGGLCNITLLLNHNCEWQEWTLRLWRLRDGVRKVDLHSRRKVDDGGYGCWLDLAPVESIEDLQRLWRALTGQEWGAKPQA